VTGTAPLPIKLAADELLGQPNRRLSRVGELRYGTHGSLSVDLSKNTWFDHELGEGGGVIDLVRRELGQDALIDWLEAHGCSRQTPVETVYRYQDESGAHLFDVVRLEPKSFRQRAADGSWGVKGIRRVLYRLPRIVAAPDGEKVFVVEGEKDVQRLEAEGLLATTNVGGAGKWRDEYSASLRGKHVASSRAVRPTICWSWKAHKDDASRLLWRHWRARGSLMRYRKWAPRMLNPTFAGSG